MFLATFDTWFLGHTWSLSVEEQFYLLWPLILKLSGPKRGKWAALAVVVTAPFDSFGLVFSSSIDPATDRNDATHARGLINDRGIASVDLPQ